MHIQRKDITAVILAGGAGRRAGSKDKGLLIWRDKPLIEHVLNRLAPQTGPLLISCNRNAEIYRRYGPTIEDVRADFQGPLAGLEAAQDAISTPYILLSACDTPLLPTDLSKRLQHSLLQHPNELPAVAYASDGQRNHYLCALLHRDCLTTLGSFLDSGERAVHRWYAMQHTFVADFSDQPAGFSNLNTLQTT
jgi:molybdopterin-guanine dinucleotide biosynthesis protein A